MPNPWTDEIKLCAKAYQQKKKQKGLNVQITRKGKKVNIKVPKSAFKFKENAGSAGAKFTAGSQKVQKKIIEADKFNQMFQANINSQVMTEPKKRMMAVEEEAKADPWQMPEEERMSVEDYWHENMSAIFKSIKLNKKAPPPPKQPFDEWQAEKWEEDISDDVISIEDRKIELGIA
jgi:hypothetical protein